MGSSKGLAQRELSIFSQMRYLRRVWLTSLSLGMPQRVKPCFLFPVPVPSVAPGNLGEKHVPWPHPGLAERETLRLRPSNLF